MSLQAKFPACHTTVILQMTSVKTLISPTVRSGSINQNSNFRKTSNCLRSGVAVSLMGDGQLGEPYNLQRLCMNTPEKGMN
jgi:hypothetical protein